MNTNQIHEYSIKNYTALLELHEQLCKIPAPSLHEEKRAEFCLSWLEAIGAKGAYIDDALNVIFPVNCENKNGITVFVAHTDTVFPDEEPMPYVDDGEKIHCPGCGDDTACLAALMFAAKYIVDYSVKPEEGILIVLNSGEEGLGNLHGTRHVMKDYEGRVRQFVSFDSKYNGISDRCVGSCRYKVSVNTKGGHSFRDFGNENAINKLSQIISKIYELKVPDDGVSKTTYNVGIIDGGTSVNSIAQSAQILCEYRSDNAEYLNIMKQKFKNIFSEASSEAADVRVTVVGERPCAKNVDVNKIDILRNICSSIVEDITGSNPELYSASTDCNIPLSMGIPAICIGTFLGGGNHTREEWISKESLIPGLEVCIRAIIKIGAEFN